MQLDAITMSCNLILKKNGFKLTPQRRLILDIIHNADGHLTAEEILSHVQTRVPGINKSTIYRTLDLLENLGCVVKSGLKDRFIYHHAEEGHHHHLVCRECGRILDCDESLFHTTREEVYKKHGFRADFRHTVISGICAECQRGA